MTRYKYLRRLSIIFILCLLIPTILIISIFWRRTKQELVYYNQRYSQKMAEAFGSAMIGELTQLKQHAANISVKSKQADSAFYEGFANFNSNVYWYYEAVNELFQEYSTHGASDCSIYYYDSGRIITKSSCQTIDAYIREQYIKEKLDLSSALYTFFAPDNYQSSKMIFSVADSIDGQSNDMLVGFCTLLGRYSDRVLIFYRISALDNKQLSLLARLNSGVEFNIHSNSDDTVYLSMLDDAVDSTIDSNPQYYAEYEYSSLIFSVQLHANSLQNHIIEFYQSMRLIFIISSCIVPLIIAIALFIAYRPIHNLIRELDVLGGNNLDEFSAIRNSLKAKDFTIYKQRSQIMSLLLEHLIYGGHISHRQLLELGLDISLSPCFCVFLIEGEAFLSGESSQLVKSTEKEFHIRLFMTENDDEKYSVAIAFLSLDNSKAISIWIHQWLQEHYDTEYTITAGKVVDKVDDIRASYISCYKKGNNPTNLRIVKKSLQELEQTENKKQKQQDEILQYIEENYRNPSLSQTQVADSFQISTYTISRLFKNQVGMGFPEYINGKRIEYAKELLLTTSLSTRDISEMIGIPNYNYFLKLFKEASGFSPTMFRSKMCKEDL